jgi:uncharacterized OB-fold protein
VSSLANTAGRLVADGLLVDVDGAVHLLASRCADCAAVTFPAQPSCPRCAGDLVEPHVLARRGTLWTYTIQGFPPKTPYLAVEASFRPFGVGYVDLDGEVLVESRLVADDLASLRIGMAMELVLEPFHRDQSGEDIVTFAFAPDAGTPDGGQR